MMAAQDEWTSEVERPWAAVVEQPWTAAAAAENPWAAKRAPDQWKAAVEKPWMHRHTVGVCITGGQLTLLSYPVHSTFLTHVREPLLADNAEVDVFISTMGEAVALDAIRAAYAPIAVSTTPNDALVNATSRSQSQRCTTFSRVELSHWITVESCYGLVRAEESRRS